MKKSTRPDSSGKNFDRSVVRGAVKHPSLAQTGANGIQQEKMQGYQFADVVSGQFDTDEVSVDVAPSKRVLLPQVENPKLHTIQKLLLLIVAQRPKNANSILAL